MSPARRARLIAGLLLSVTGCAQSGSLVGRGTTVGSLKASVSQLEYENQQLRREVASLKTENRQIENRLVQEESLNGDLSARLDDARNLIGRAGGDPGPDADRKTIPAGQSNRKRRKAPFAQIPGRIDALPPSDTETGPSAGWGRPAAPSQDDIGPTGQTDRSTLWLPVARGATNPSRPLR
jgi:hypothetical protein